MPISISGDFNRFKEALDFGASKIAEFGGRLYSSLPPTVALKAENAAVILRTTADYLEKGISFSGSFLVNELTSKINDLSISVFEKKSPEETPSQESRTELPETAPKPSPESEAPHLDRILTEVSSHEKATLLGSEAAQIEKFVEAHREEWNQPGFESARYLHEVKAGDKNKDGTERTPREGPPRTIEVFKDETGQVRVMVLLKHKEGSQALGKGSTKSATLALDWDQGQLYAHVNVRLEEGQSLEESEHIQSVIREHAMLQKVGGLPSVSQPFLAFHAYTGAKGVQKYVGYQALYNGGNLRDLVKGPLEPKQRRSLFRDVAEGTASLASKGVEHRDLHTGNIFIDKKAGQTRGQALEQTPRALVADFDISAERGSKITDEALDELDRGMPTKQSPQRGMALEMRYEYRKLAKQRGENDPEVLELRQKLETFILDTAASNDAWSLGLLGLEILLRDEPQALNQALKPKMGITLGGIGYEDIGPKTYKQMQKALDKVLDEYEAQITDREEKKMFGVVRQLLQVDPKKRISAEKAKKLLS